MGALSESIAKCTQLETLNLDSNIIGMPGIEALMKVVAEHPSLREVKCSNQKQPFGGQGEECMASAIVKNTNILKFGYSFRQAAPRNKADRAIIKNNEIMRQKRKNGEEIYDLKAVCKQRDPWPQPWIKVKGQRQLGSQLADKVTGMGLMIDPDADVGGESRGLNVGEEGEAKPLDIAALLAARASKLKGTNVGNLEKEAEERRKKTLLAMKQSEEESGRIGTMMKVTPGVGDDAKEDESPTSGTTETAPPTEETAEEKPEEKEEEEVKPAEEAPKVEEKKEEPKEEPKKEEAKKEEEESSEEESEDEDEDEEAKKKEEEAAKKKKEEEEAKKKQDAEERKKKEEEVVLSQEEEDLLGGATEEELVEAAALLNMSDILTSEQINAVFAGDKPEGSMKSGVKSSKPKQARITKADVETELDVVELNKQLKSDSDALFYLCVSNQPLLERETLDLIINSVATCKKMKHLSLSMLGITDKSCIALSEAIDKCTQLETLNLDSNIIGMPGIEALMKVVSLHPSLREVKCSNQKQPFGGQGEECMVFAIVKNQNILRFGYSFRQ